MEVNDIFKRPALPKSALKRKAAGPAAPLNEEPASKIARIDPNSLRGSTSAKVSTEEEEDLQDDLNDFAPGNDADYFKEEDGEGRMYGGGLNSEQKEILDILDTDTRDDAAMQMTVQDCRKTLVNLERAINKNREQRTKHAADPTKFVDSEMALDESLHALLLFTQDPVAFYPEIVRLNVSASMVDLLSHENVDIAISVIKILEELTDEDVGEGVEDEDAFLAALSQLIKALMAASIEELLVANMARLSPTESAEQQGLYHSYGLLENMLSSADAQQAAKGLLATDYVTQSLKAILPPAPSKGKGTANGTNGIIDTDSARETNRFYAAEILAILLSLPEDAGEQGRKSFLKEDGIDAALRVLSIYRKRDPRGTEEAEFMENIFDLICQCLNNENGKKLFREAEGTELMVLLMKERKMARSRSIKVLDFALAHHGEGAKTCVQFVEALGLKTLFPAFIGKSGKKEQAAEPEDIEHILGIMASLLSALESDSPERIRLLAKFVSEEYDKIDRLIEIREAAQNRIGRWEADASARQDADLEMTEEDLFLGKLENGLATLQLADYVLGMLCAEDDGVREHATMLLARADKTLIDVAQVLDEYGSTIEGDDESPGAAKRELIMDIIENLAQSVNS